MAALLEEENRVEEEVMPSERRLGFNAVLHFLQPNSAFAFTLL